MFRRPRTNPVAWEEPAPPRRATALAAAGLAGTLSLVVGGLMWAGSAVSQPRTFDAGGTAGASASRVGVVTVPSGATASTAPLSPVPLPPPQVDASLAPATLPTVVSFVAQTATPAPVTTTVGAPPTPTTSPPMSPSSTVTSIALPTSTLPNTTLPAATTTTTTTSTTTSSTTTTSTTTTSTTTPAPVGASLWDIVQTDPALGRFAGLIEQGGVAASLEVDAAHTVFAPDDDAIAAYAATPEGEAEFANPQSIRAFVLRHLVLVELDTRALFALDRVESATGEWLVVDASAGAVGGARLVVADVRADNGVLHVASGIVVAGAAP